MTALHRMKIGTVTWTLGITDPAALMQRAGALGLDSLQYAGDHRDGDGADLRRHADAAGVALLAIDPFDAGPDDPDQASEALAIDYYRRVVDFAVDAGQVPVTLHGLSKWTENCADATSARARLLACCRAVDAYARERGVRTLYEVCNHYEVPLIHTADECRALLDEIGGDNVRMILDSFHMNVNERDPLATLRRHAPVTAIYHLSDSGRGGIGSGHIDFQAHCDALLAGGFTGDVATELVLAHLTPSDPPQTDADRQQLDAAIRHSTQAWKQLLHAASGAGDDGRQVA